MTPTVTPTNTPTSTPTNTPTATPTITPTPVGYDVTFRLTIKQTPIPGAPLNFGFATGLTNMSGEVKIRVAGDEYVSVSSGLPVIEFTPLYDTGANFAAESPVIIPAKRLVEPLPDICSLIVGSEEHVYFPYENLTDIPMSVPLKYNLLNRMLSPRGEAIPPDLFAPGLDGNGFSIPKRYLDDAGTLAGAWQFIGTMNYIPSPLKTCASSGKPACEPLPPPKLNKVFEYPKNLVIRLTSETVRLGRVGKWKPAGDYRGPFFVRGGKSLAKIRAILNRLKGNNYICSSPQPNCRQIRVPKAALMSAFGIIYTGDVPPGLMPLKKTQARETLMFKKILATLPNTMTQCK